MNKQKDEETSVADNLVISAPSYFKSFECGENFLNNLDASYERLWIATSQEKLDTAIPIYWRGCMLKKKEKDYTELSNTITTIIDNNNTPFSNMNIWEAILKVMIEDK